MRTVSRGSLAGAKGGNTILVVSNKTREQLCDELLCDIEKAAGVPLDVAVRMATQMANALVWPKPEDQTDAFIKAITTLAEGTLGIRGKVNAIPG